MQNPLLDRRLVDCRELSVMWRKFLDLFNSAVRAEEIITPENEQQFLESKSRIAMLHDSFMESLKHDQQIGQNIFGIIARCITLRHVHKMSQAETKKIEIEWHESYLLLNETVTSLEEEISRLAQINPTKYHLSRAMARFKENLKWFVGSKLFKLFVGAVVIIFILFGIPVFGIYDYDNLRNVKGVDQVYFSWLNFKRSTFEKSAPFGKIDNFISEYLPQNAPPSGFNYEPSSSDKTKAAGNFGYINLEGNRTMRAALLDAKDFRALRLENIRSSSQRVEVYLFWFFDNESAYDLALQFNKVTNKGANMPVEVFSINNLLIVLESGQKELRQKISTGVFKQAAF